MIIIKHGASIVEGKDFEVGADIMTIIDATLKAEKNNNINIIAELVRCAKETDNLEVLLKFAKRIQDEL